MEEIGIEQARTTLGEIVDKARLAEIYTILTRHGKPAAAVVSVRCLLTLLAYVGLDETATWADIVAKLQAPAADVWPSIEPRLVSEVSVIYDHGRIATIRLTANWPFAYRDDTEDRLADVVGMCLPVEMQVSADTGEPSGSDQAAVATQESEQ